MRRVLIIGPGGAGKSTLAGRLADATGLPVVHLDARYWRPGWDATPVEEWRSVVSTLVDAPEWIMDGNYGGTLDLRIPAADTIIYLDWPRALCIWGVVKRRLRPGTANPSRAAGCPERLSPEFLWWIWTYPTRRRPDILRRLKDVSDEKTVIVLRSRREMNALVARCVRLGELS
jgi:adenylate kinase family enzyme